MAMINNTIMYLHGRKMLGTGSEDRDAPPPLSRLVGGDNVGSLGRREVGNAVIGDVEFYSHRAVNKITVVGETQPVWRTFAIRPNCGEGVWIPGRPSKREILCDSNEPVPGPRIDVMGCKS